MIVAISHDAGKDGRYPMTGTFSYLIGVCPFDSKPSPRVPEKEPLRLNICRYAFISPLDCFFIIRRFNVLKGLLQHPQKGHTV